MPGLGQGQSTQHWHTLIIYLIIGILDSLIFCKWENTLDIKKLPTMPELEAFLQCKYQVMESIDSSKLHKQSAVNSQMLNKIES